MSLRGLHRLMTSPFRGAFLVFGVVFISCSGPPADPSQEELIRVGSSQITVRQFKQIQDMSQDYYWQENDATDDDDKSLRLLNQVVEELLLVEKARELEIDISDKELESAVQNIKDDYPEGTFEQVLLENAVSYDFWRERLRVRLLIEKVISKELESHVNITPEDIASYYKEYYADAVESEKGDMAVDRNKDINEIIVKRLRKLKAEERYKGWIKELEQVYPVEVNWKLWKKMAVQ